ncbi:MAG: phosphoenolpyruvate-utilizing N-terminal domain-containing protein [Lachnospiraceae bacterium]
MQVYSGKSVFRGIAIGKISVYRKNEQQVKRVQTEDSDGEWARYQAAREASIEQLGELYDKACREVGETNAAIFEIHQMMLEDDDYNESVENIIRTQQVNAEYAVAATGDNFSQMFAAMDDDYMREPCGRCKGYL